MFKTLYQFFRGIHFITRIYEWYICYQCQYKTINMMWVEGHPNWLVLVEQINIWIISLTEKQKKWSIRRNRFFKFELLSCLVEASWNGPVILKDLHLWFSRIGKYILDSPSTFLIVLVHSRKGLLLATVLEVDVS